MNYKFSTPIQVRFKDLDLLGHVNGSIYFTYFETTRLLFTKKVLGDINWNEKGMVVVKNEMNYLLPIFLYDDVCCNIGVVEYGKTSMKIGVQIQKKINDKMINCAEGYCILVCFDGQTKKVFEVPEEWKEKIRIYEENI